MSVSSTNLSGNNVTAFNRHRRIKAEKARAEAEAQKARKAKKREAKPVESSEVVEEPKPEAEALESSSETKGGE